MVTVSGTDAVPAKAIIRVLPLLEVELTSPCRGNSPMALVRTSYKRNIPVALDAFCAWNIDLDSLENYLDRFWLVVAMAGVSLLMVAIFLGRLPIVAPIVPIEHSIGRIGNQYWCYS